MTAINYVLKAVFQFIYINKYKSLSLRRNQATEDFGFYDEIKYWMPIFNTKPSKGRSCK